MDWRATQPKMLAMLLVLLGLASLAMAAPATAPAQPPLQISDKFPRIKAPGTGRLAVQLTAGAEACYPLYYFIPAITRDGKYLIHHRYENKQVQLWRLNLQTAESVQLTRATGTNTDWRPWQVEPGLGGIMDYRGVLNVARNLVIYFDRNTAHCIDLETLKDQVLFELPADREPIGQNTTTLDGKWLAYIDAPAGAQNPRPCKGSKLMAYNFDTREQKTLCTVDNAIHHVLTWDNEHFIVNHPPGHNGIIWTDLTSGKWTELRKGDEGVRGQSCHQLPTAQGISYEVFGGGAGVISGLYDPFTRRRFEFCLPPEFGYTHTGWDPEGRLWFWETTGRTGHSLWYLEKLDRSAGGTYKPLAGNWPIVTARQRGHFHPQITPDRRWVLMTGGDEQKRAQVFLLDLSDVPDTIGISRDLLSATGANDTRAPGHLVGPPAMTQPSAGAVLKLGGAALAEVTLSEDGQTYRGESYRFVGSGPIEVTIPLAPRPGHVLELRWGAKNDMRFATITINGKSMPLSAGGHDGYIWLRVPIPEGVTGDKYEIKLAATENKAAFIAGIRIAETAGGRK